MSPEVVAVRRTSLLRRVEHPMDQYPEESELIAFFGQDSDPIDKDEAEFFGRSRFTMTLDDGDVLAFVLDRSFGDLYVTLWHERAKEINLVAHEVWSVKIERLHGRETILAEFGTEPQHQQVRLTLRPKLDLRWGFLE